MKRLIKNYMFLKMLYTIIFKKLNYFRDEILITKIKNKKLYY